MFEIVYYLQLQKVCTVYFGQYSNFLYAGNMQMAYYIWGNISYTVSAYCLE